MADKLKDQDIENAEFAFGIYDCDGTGKIDAYDIPDVLRALNLNPTLELCEKMGATKKRGEKKLPVEEFLPIFAQVRGTKDQGSYEDFMECLKLYDKMENGTMLLAELEHSLKALGEKLSDDEVNELFADCMDPEDDEGNIFYAPFLTKMMNNPIVYKK
jgi:Ca2+-binding EF-hand superfamily protein